MSSSYERINAYLEAHPTPWRYVCETDLSDPGVRPELIADGYHDARQCDQEVRDVVEDANGNIVFASWDRDETASHVEGDVRALVDFVNMVGEDYEPPCGWPGVDYGPMEPVDDAGWEHSEGYEYAVQEYDRFRKEWRYVHYSPYASFEPVVNGEKWHPELSEAQRDLNGCNWAPGMDLRLVKRPYRRGIGPVDYGPIEPVD